MEKIYGLRFEMTPLYRISAFVIDAEIKLVILT